MVAISHQLKAMSTYTKVNLLTGKWKSNLSDEIKQELFQAVAVSVLLYGCTTWRELHEDTVCYFEQILEAAPNKTVAVWPLTSHLTNHQERQARHNRFCWRSKDKLISDILQWTLTHEHTSVGWPRKTYIIFLKIITMGNHPQRLCFYSWKCHLNWHYFGWFDITCCMFTAVLKWQPWSWILILGTKKLSLGLLWHFPQTTWWKLD